MADYKLSIEAEKDVIGIYEKGIEDFGLYQARKYLLDLNTHFLLLSKNHNLGHASVDLNPVTLRKFKFKAHMIYYQPTDYGVFIIRVLNQRMSEKKQLGQ